jgi:hypothetical protein
VCVPKAGDDDELLKSARRDQSGLRGGLRRSQRVDRKGNVKGVPRSDVEEVEPDAGTREADVVPTKEQMSGLPLREKRLPRKNELAGLRRMSE